MAPKTVDGQFILRNNLKEQSNIKQNDIPYHFRYRSHRFGGCKN